MNSPVTIREGAAEDAPIVLRLWRDADSAPSKTDDERAIRTLLSRDPGALLIAESEGEPIGTLIVGWDGWRGGLYRLAVLPGWRRRGIARLLVTEAQDRLRRMDVRRVAAMVITEHEHAAAFWRAVGYEADPRLGRFVRMLD
jgi:ribosomal protein S18 acetylase RimI-like enzyme